MRYRNHLILTTPNVDAATDAWKAIAHIEFTQQGTFNNVVIRSSALFKSKKAAEKQLIREAKEWSTTGSVKLLSPKDRAVRRYHLNLFCL